MRLPLLALLVLSAFATAEAPNTSPSLVINEADYFEKAGLNVTVFSDIYPDGHQTGVSIIQHGLRVAANGDIRLEASPGQWSPVPKGGEQTVDRTTQTISQTLSYPDESKNRVGFNPIEYPDLTFSYQVKVKALEGNSVKVSVDFDEPLPDEWIGKVGFNFELFPGHLFGKSWIMDEATGLFPQQPNGPIQQHQGEWINSALAVGKTLVVAPGEEKQRLVIEANQGELTLLDGRSNHNNGWYIVRTLVPKGATKNAIEWTITAHTIEGWQYKPVIQVSQLGYAQAQSKKVIIEQDKTDSKASPITLYRLDASGKRKVASGVVKPWGKFLRYNYFSYDFSDIKTPGLYVVEYRDQTSHTFKIGNNVFDRHAWQPTLEYYLPVQMCHMHVAEKYRVWHGLCHDDDALMSPVNTNHFDGYKSGDSTLTTYKPLQAVPGLNKGGWHDAGDYDLRIESQMTTVWLLAMMAEEFNVDYDATSINQETKVVEIHQPDGKNDINQQIEHGLLSVLGAYESLGRLYRGIIVPTVRQYVHLGDAATQTDNRVYDASVENAVADDRWVFTEENPNREVAAAAGLAAASRVIKQYNPSLSKKAIEAAEAIYLAASSKELNIKNRVFALAELSLATQNKQYVKELTQYEADIIEHIQDTGWAIGRVMPMVKKRSFVKNIDRAVKAYQQTVKQQATETPYGVPYKPHIWGAGWGIQHFAVKQYFFRQAWPRYTSDDDYLNALNFILGVHPGENTQSFASGVGANSATVAYGVNRADWSYIPGGVISGTALIRPDLPELKIWPFFWQQTEYVMGGGATNYMFLVLAANEKFNP
ncbi:glycoside hydrolase family 9 protein [Teredinibacter purpureus]|uniref:glycoside hydrolase family 9 protein n=1 Tax=Teredinibacter purpureus TaxID=2731756 RepID=UPI0005F7ADD3|nr:glycoside hydrolase family 9 protein [Teredinibacter purpureus]